VTRTYRLLHIIDHLGSGGAQETLLSLLKYADRQRFQVEVATLHGQGYYWEAIRRLQVPIHSLSPYKFVPLYLSNLLYLLRRGKFDLIHCHLTASNLIAKPLAVLAGVPYILNYDQNDIHRKEQKWLMWLDRLANLLTHHIVAVSASTRDFLLQQEKVSPEKITVIYNGVDLERFRPAAAATNRLTWRHQWNLPENCLVVGGVGRLRRQKNFSFFLQVAREVLQNLPEVCFVIAGEGPEREKLESLAHDLGIASRVRFLGYVRDMAALYPAMDVLLMTSHAEGTPLTILEAMAVGVPLVATQVDGMAEVLDDEADAFLVPPGDVSLFAQRTCRLLQDKLLAWQFGQSALAKVHKHYAAPAMARQVEAIYQRCLQD
jgi:glycosyltransferase involved in cell wall biosynthesis